MAAKSKKEPEEEIKFYFLIKQIYHEYMVCCADIILDDNSELGANEQSLLFNLFTEFDYIKSRYKSDFSPKKRHFPT